LKKAEVNLLKKLGNVFTVASLITELSHIKTIAIQNKKDVKFVRL
jgi:hypothetical protein